jgi:hypothetical protein
MPVEPRTRERRTSSSITAGAAVFRRLSISAICATMIVAALDSDAGSRRSLTVVVSGGAGRV